MDFDKESLFFITDLSNNVEKHKLNLPSNLNILSNFLSELQFLIYYINPSQCQHIVYLEKKYDYYHVLNKLFPQLIFHFDYDEDLKILKDNDKTFAIISNSNKEDMEHQKIILEKYPPYAGLVDFYLTDNNYLDGLLIKKLFCKQESTKLVVRGIGYKDWNIKNIKNNLKNNKFNLDYINPFSRDNRTIYEERGFFNSFDETATIVIIMDYLKKINSEINYDIIMKILLFILDNIVKYKNINLTMEYLLN